jgi:hypothetical protein
LNAAKKVILLLWLLLAASLGNAAAFTPGATENRIWEKSLAATETRQAEAQQTAGGRQENGGVAYDNASASLLAAETGGGSTIGLGLSEDLSNFRGTDALTYQNGAWQQAGLTTVDWGKAAVDDSWFRMSFNEASQNAGAIQFDVSSFSTTYANPGMTSWEFNSVINNPSLLGKTTFIQNGGQVIWNGATFVKP